MAEFRMPSLGADMEAGTLVRFCRRPGEVLARGDIIAEVETDKGIIEVELFEAGVLDRLLVEPGTKVPVGTPLALLRDVAQPTAPAGAVAAAPARAPQITPRIAEAPAPQTTPQIAEALASSVVPERRAPQQVPRATPSTRRRARELGVELSALNLPGVVSLRDVEAAARARDAVTVSAAQQQSPAARVRISPAARKRAQELGVDLAQLSSHTPGAPIELSDVERAAARITQRGTPAASQPSEEHKQALRRAIAAAMTRSKREIPHYYLTTTIDLSRALNWLSTLNARLSVDERVVPSALLLKAVALTAARHREFNAWWQDDHARSADHVHLGVAIALRGGGVVAPAIPDCDRLSVVALMTALTDLVRRAREGTLRSSELGTATLTVTNLGERGAESVLPIIFSPQTAIVGFGRIASRPWLEGDALVARPLVTATLAGDHRATDGHAGSRFLSSLDSLLQTPEQL